MTLQNKSLQERTSVLWRLETGILPAAFFHSYLHELRGRLKVKRKTECVRIGERID
jgi:hypothetical protein